MFYLKQYDDERWTKVEENYYYDDDDDDNDDDDGDENIY